MNLSHPITSLIPSLAGPVLEVLAGTTRPLSGREVHRLLPVAGSQKGVQRVLDELATHGIVTQTEAGAAILNSLNRDHALAPLIVEASGLRARILDTIGTIIEDEAPQVVRAVLFGSTARGDSDHTSDVDVALVWPSATDDGTRAQAAARIRARIVALTGNPGRILDYTVEAFERLGDTAPDLHEAIRSEGIELLAERHLE